MFHLLQQAQQCSDLPSELYLQIIQSKIAHALYLPFHLQYTLTHVIETGVDLWKQITLKKLKELAPSRLHSKHILYSLFPVKKNLARFFYNQLSR